MKKKSLVAIAVIIGIIGIIAVSASPQSIGIQKYDTIATHMGSPVLGQPDAPITIIEFGDYQCHQCHNWYLNTKPAIMENYIESGKANLIFVDFAFLGRDSAKAAQASYCAQDQQSYWKYHNKLYSAQHPKIDGGWANTKNLKSFASILELDTELFDQCMDSGKYSDRVQFNIKEAKRIGANATPTFVILGPGNAEEKLVGAQPFSSFKQVLDSMI